MVPSLRRSQRRSEAIDPHEMVLARNQRGRHSLPPFRKLRSSTLRTRAPLKADSKAPSGAPAISGIEAWPIVPISVGPIVGTRIGGVRPRPVVSPAVVVAAIGVSVIGAVALPSAPAA